MGRTLAVGVAMVWVLSGPWSGQPPGATRAESASARLPAVAARSASSLRPASAGARPGSAAAVDPVPRVVYRRPVPGRVLDPFRAPVGHFGPGNRGIDLATVPGEPVMAAAAGIVTFAGLVAGVRYVVVLHADRIRTSYSPLDATSVKRGAVVAAGQEVGRAGTALHLGARAGQAYVDPMVLFERRGGGARLVPVAGGSTIVPAGIPGGIPAGIPGDDPLLPAVPGGANGTEDPVTGPRAGGLPARE